MTDQGAADSVALAQIIQWLKVFAEKVNENASYLTELDSAIGDADHGSNMNRGMKAVVAVLDAEYTGIAAVAKKVGMTLVSTVGGASGPLYGTFFLRFATSVGDATEVDGGTLGTALRAGADGIVARGRASLGDKTMVDVWLPAVDAYDAASVSGIQDGLDAMSKAAEAARDATEPMIARKGRASYLGDRSKGHLDPGATSTALLLAAAAEALGQA